VASNPPAVVLGGEAIAVSVARSLGRRGVPVYALGVADVDPVRFSRYCTEFVDLGSGEGVQERWLDWLKRTSGRPRVLIPCNDDGIELIARSRADLLELKYQAIEANDGVLLTMLDKSKTYELAARLGVATPWTHSVSDVRELEHVLEGVSFPLAVKPRHSYRFARHFGLRQKLFVVGDRSELENVLASLGTLDVDLLLTEVIPGGDDQLWTCTAYLRAEGTPLIHYTRRKVRQYPPSFGRGCYYLLEWDSEVAELGLRFLRGAGVRGLANVEFKRDARDGSLKLIECNHRLDGATELGRAAGVDLPLLVYERALGRDGQLGRAREGVRLWNPIEDTRSAWHSWRHGELSLAGWAGSVLRPLHFQVFDVRDPKPSVIGAARIVAHALRRTRRPALTESG